MKRSLGNLISEDPEEYWLRIASIKRRQASQASTLASVASGIGEYGISNSLWHLEGVLLQQRANCMAAAYRAREAAEVADHR